MNTAGVMRKWRSILVLAATVALVLVLFGGVAQAAPGGGAIYTETNATPNQVLMFDRAPDGTLSAAVAFDTGGMGAPFVHPPQGAVALSENGRWLFAVNAGSNDVTVFAVRPWGLTMVDREPCSGTTPVSLTVHGSLLYVLEAGSGNIEGFRIGLFGRLHPIAGSVQPLSGLATYPEQIGFNPRGNLLVVTELDSNKIDTYAVNLWGVAAPPVVHDSSGPAPYGFAFDKKGTLLVSEASQALSSYEANAHQFDSISGSVSNGGHGSPCWVAITGNGKYAYTGNGGDGTISSYRVSPTGKLSLLSGTAGQGGAILDLAFSNNSRFLYALDAGNSAIDIFGVAANGSLNAIGSVSVPAGADGLAAR
jgi:6-phosphogluconolactonase